MRNDVANGKIQTARFVIKRLQLMILPLQKSRAHSWRRSKQIQQQPHITTEVADQIKISLRFEILQAATITILLLQICQSASGNETL
jgi:hypothetical protein